MNSQTSQIRYDWLYIKHSRNARLSDFRGTDYGGFTVIITVDNANKIK